MSSHPVPRPPQRPRLRALMLVPAAALLSFGVPALAADGGSAGTPTTTRITLGSPGSADGRLGAEAAPSGTVAPGWTGEAAVVADLVGVTWTGDPTAEFAVEARGRRGRWIDHGTVGAVDSRPDAGAPDAVAAGRTGRVASEPLWISGSDAVRVRLVSGTTADVGLDAVRSAPPEAPAGAAGALGDALGLGSVDRAFGLTLVLVGLLVGAVALGWSPWRSRRTLALLAVTGLVVLTACGEPEPPPPPVTTTTSTTTTTTTLPPVPQPAVTLQSSWGPDLAWNPASDCAPGPEIAPAGVKFAVLHHTVNSNGYTADQSRAMVRAMWAYHVNTLGYCDIAYNFVVDQFGQIFEGRRGGIDRAVVAAHTGGFNTASTGVAFLGTLTSVQPTPDAWRSVAGLLAWKLRVHGVNPNLGFTATSAGNNTKFPMGTVVRMDNAIVGHRDLGPTACPGDAFYPQLPWMRGDVVHRMGY